MGAARTDALGGTDMASEWFQIVRVDASGGYAFARRPGADERYFIHATDAALSVEQLKPGDRVTGEVVETPNGYRLVRVRLASAASPIAVHQNRN
jgi:hypothetical protein